MDHGTRRIDRSVWTRIDAVLARLHVCLNMERSEMTLCLQEWNRSEVPKMIAGDGTIRSFI